MPAKKKTIKKTGAPNSAKAVIEGVKNGLRVPSRILEEDIQEAVRSGATDMLVRAMGQHGIGGRIWPRKDGSIVKITVEGTSGQRVGSMGMEGTEILVKGSSSDDIGWINCGAKITVLGDVTNGAHNAAAQGILYVQGGGGARCDTMTKHNPRFEPPQSWYFRDVGDSFAEFKAGGISVVCGVNPRNPERVLGYRPCVGMVGGAIYFRGNVQEYSKKDVKLLELTDADWQWLAESMKTYLKAIDRADHYKELTSDRNAWRKFIAYTPKEKTRLAKKPVTIKDFVRDYWEKEVGKGGIFAPFLDHDQSVLPYITTGEYRRNKPIWANEKYLPPCAYACPSLIPSHKRARLLREGKTEEAISLVLEYSPLPATVCGTICPNLCMQDCTRGRLDRPLDIKKLGFTALETPLPQKQKPTGYKAAVIGGGPGGLSAAWQLKLKGHDVDLYEAEDRLGGKIELCIPRERLPHEILRKELDRFLELGVNVHLKTKVDKELFKKIYKEHDAVIVACGAHWPRKIDFPGSDAAATALDFLKDVNTGAGPDLKGKDVVVIGAGNVGMDVAVEAFNSGAKSVKAVDVQKPAAFGKELYAAKSKGAEIIWPRMTERYDAAGNTIHFTDGSSMKADYVIIAIGELPIVDFLPKEVHTERGWITADKTGQTSDPKVYAIGDATKPGLVTHAIGNGRITAEAIHAKIVHADYMPEVRQGIPYERLRTEYYDSCRLSDLDPKEEGGLCMSCATCRDCRMCEKTCFWDAISRVEKPSGSFEYVVDADKCIGCGFCAGICPCGIWEMVENV